MRSAQLLRRRRLDREPPLDRLAARQRVAREQQPLGALGADAVRPQRGRRRAPHARRRVADLGLVLDHEQVRAERHVGAAGDAEAVHHADDGLARVEEAHEAADVAAHHRVVDHRVPGAARGRGWRPITRGSSGEPSGARRSPPGPLRPRPLPSPRRSRRGHSRRRSPGRCPTAASRARPGRGRRARRTKRAPRRAPRVMPLPRSGRSSVIRATRPVDLVADRRTLRHRRALYLRPAARIPTRGPSK